MTLPVLIILGILLSLDSAIFETLFLRQRSEGNHRISLFYKVLASAGFCGVGLLTALYAGKIQGCLIFGGLAMGLLGDFLLGMRKLSQKDHTVYFFLGMLVFSGGHIFYLTAVYRLCRLSSSAVFLVFLILMLCAETFLYAHKIRQWKVHLAGLIYIAVEALMAAASLVLAYCHTSLGSLLLATGAISFFASDNLLCAYTFGDLKIPEVDQAVHVTYLGAQIFIAWSILFL